MKRLLSFVLILLVLLVPIGCSNADEGVKYENLSLADMSASGNATIHEVTDTSILPKGVGQKQPPQTQSYVIGFNGVGTGNISIDKTKIKANSYLTFTYFYERTCTPSFMGLYLLRIKGVVERENPSFGKYVIKHFNQDGDFIAGIYSDSGVINNNLRSNWLTLEVYFEEQPSTDPKFGCVWISNGVNASFYITDVRISEQSLMQQAK
jgi:hypothetical protein